MYTQFTTNRNLNVKGLVGGRKIIIYSEEQMKTF